MTRAARAIHCVVVAVCAGCAARSAPLEPGVSSTECLLLRENPSGVIGMDVGSSVPLGDGRSIFVFGDTFLGGWTSSGARDVSGAVHSAAATVDLANAKACFAGAKFMSDEDEVAQLLEPVGADDGDMVWPLGPGIAHDGVVDLAFTWVAHDASADFGFKTLGNGIVRGKPGAPIAVDVHALSAPPSEAMPSAWLVDHDDVYLYRCGSHVAPWFYPCVVGRTKLETAASLDAYAYFVSGRGYVGTYAEATVVAEGAPAFTVTKNAWTGSLLEIYVEPFSREVSARTALAPEGPFSDKVKLLACSLPSDDPKSYCYAAFEHAELAAPSGREIAVTYDTNTTDFAAMIHHPSVYFPRLVTVDLATAGFSKAPAPRASTAAGDDDATRRPRASNRQSSSRVE